MRVSRFIRTFGVMAIAALLIVSVVGPATAHSGRNFGAKVNPNIQPSNSNDGVNCGNEPVVALPCTFVMREAFGFGGNRRHETKASRNGVIKKIKLIASAPGSFRLQIAKVKGGQNKAKIVRNGPKIEYEGQPPFVDPDSVDPESLATKPSDNHTFVVEVFKVNIPVKKGQSLAVRTRRTHAMRCQSGGGATLTFQKPLPVGGSFRKTTGTEGCFMLIKATMK